MIDERITASRIKYQNPYAHLNDLGEFDADFSIRTSEISAESIRGRPTPEYTGQRMFTDREIEQITRKLLRLRWKNDMAKSGSANPRDQMNPISALEQLGYQVEKDYSLGQVVIKGQANEVGGTIDKEAGRVRISPQFSPEIMNFTAAHELGHAVLHRAQGLHRDKPLDGSSGSREAIEYEADKFATYFLMPEKQVRKAFKQIYGTEYFSFNEDRVFALTQGTSEAFKKKYGSLRDRSKLLSSSEQFNGKHFRSLVKQFKVSVGAMAIRLEELKLLE